MLLGNIFVPSPPGVGRGQTEKYTPLLNANSNDVTSLRLRLNSKILLQLKSKISILLLVGDVDVDDDEPMLGAADLVDVPIPRYFIRALNPNVNTCINLFGSKVL